MLYFKCLPGVVGLLVSKLDVRKSLDFNALTISSEYLIGQIDLYHSSQKLFNNYCAINKVF